MEHGDRICQDQFNIMQWISQGIHWGNKESSAKQESLLLPKSVTTSLHMVLFPLAPSPTIQSKAKYWIRPCLNYVWVWCEFASAPYVCETKTCRWTRAAGLRPQMPSGIPYFCLSGGISCLVGDFFSPGKNAQGLGFKIIRKHYWEERVLFFLDLCIFYHDT